MAAMNKELVSRAGHYSINYPSNLDSSVPVAGDPDDAEYKSVILRESPAASQPLNRYHLSMFLEDATGIGEPHETFFMNNSEIHVICPPVPDLLDRTFVAHYYQGNHSLGLRTLLDPSKALFDGAGDLFPEGSFLVGLSVAFNYRRLSPAIEKYAIPIEDKYKNQEQHLEIGQSVASLVYAAAELGWEVRVLGPQLGFEALKRLTGLIQKVDLVNEAPVAALLVFPSSAMPTGPEISASRIKDKILQCFDDSLKWEGNPDRVRLGQDESLVDATALATETIVGDEIKILYGNLVRPGLSSPDFHYPPGTSTMRQILRSRRVKVGGFSDSHELGGLQFRQFLFRCCWDKYGHCHAPACFPHSAFPWTPRVHLFFIVKRVQGLAPGLYCLVRNKLHHAWITESTMSADDQVPSFYRICPHMLEVCNMTFGVAMVGTVNGVDDANYVGIYPRLLWEAGFLGELLNVEAQAQGLAASMTTSFHDFLKYRPILGINSEQLIVLSYYTVGKPSEQ